jgi:ABC-type phosphate transport system substrate-binding protein
LFIPVAGSELRGIENAREQNGVVQSEVEDGLTIIANTGISAEVLVSGEELKAIFLGKKTSIDQCTVVIAIQKDGEVHKSFLKKYIDKTPSQYKMYWKQRVFSGAGHFPKTFQTEKSLIDYVSRTKGAIGYISSRKKVETDKVKFVQIKETINSVTHTKPEPNDKQPSPRGKQDS